MGDKVDVEEVQGEVQVDSGGDPLLHDRIFGGDGIQRGRFAPHLLRHQKLYSLLQFSGAAPHNR